MRSQLPDQVLARLAGRDITPTIRTPRGHGEARAWSNFELRSAGDSGVRVVGYASTYDQPYPIWGGPENGGFNETIKAGAFNKSIAEADDVRFLVNHDGVPLARTKSGTMTLDADDVGLLVDASLDHTSPRVAEVRSAMERGDMDQMSFAFEVVKQSWSPDYSERAILEVKLYDVSVVTYPANDQTLALIGAGARAEPLEQFEAAEPVLVPAGGRSVRLARALWQQH